MAVVRLASRLGQAGGTGAVSGAPPARTQGISHAVIAITRSTHAPAAAEMLLAGLARPVPVLAATRSPAAAASCRQPRPFAAGECRSKSPRAACAASPTREPAAPFQPVQASCGRKWRPILRATERQAHRWAGLAAAAAAAAPSCNPPTPPLLEGRGRPISARACCSSVGSPEAFLAAPPALNRRLLGPASLARRAAIMPTCPACPPHLPAVSHLTWCAAGGGPAV